MDLSKLPAPWRVEDQGDDNFVIVDANGRYVDEQGQSLPKPLADKIVLWRNAEDVMLKRGWHTFRDDRQWIVLTGAFDGVHMGYGIIKAADPFTALVEADRWYVANIESKPTEPANA